MKLAARTRCALAVTAALGLGCSSPEAPGAAGTVCTMDTDCAAGLVCLAPTGGAAMCGSNLNSIAFTEDATVVATDAAAAADSPTTDAVAGETSAPPMDAGGAEVSPPAMEAGGVDAAPAPDSSAGD